MEKLETIVMLSDEELKTIVGEGGDACDDAISHLE